MSSPNEPGRPRVGESPGPATGPANGSAANNDALGARPEVADRPDVPPWQRGPAARAAQSGQPQPGQRPPERPADDGRGPAARTNRFTSGGPSTEEAPPRGDRPGPDAQRQETYASELPDLSGPMPRPPQAQQQRKPAERPGAEPAHRPPSGPRVQVGTRHKGPVRASMQIRRIDPWSTLKVSAVLSVALFFVWMIAVAFLYLVLGGMGVWSKLNSNVGDLLTSAGGGSGGELVSAGTIFGSATLIGLVNIVLLTAMATIGAFVYNLTTDLVGGVEVTLADRD
ncbi:DUF3566 domain-containing protein [Mycobacterium sp. E740]|uniref:DUF3566 domain-containing protein n=1 Tax=Mycobacterium sp. E740 TaxID=1834149 RepID=UPI0008009AC8|nr:DUF3566 domain-containing protein [Mycobacterium sp. E740]OBI81690.1 hypothetical protein A5663_15800 [Mycobacterium sp. E740]